MVREASAKLDGCFQALAHPIRRGVLEQLRAGPATVGAVSERFDVAAPTMSKHIGVLEDSGLVTRSRVGRTHYLTLAATPLKDATTWLAQYHRFWHERFDALADLVATFEADGQQRPDGG